ncbi:hypothetical protein [Enterococcus diestrammenae]|uniref:hypothetical protein n=1 Tax=Enterococcus diestrammenae TaxID=1155073 RepID=UPI0022E5DACD|nr:hypothetical protein [Enterococcus diestrammenae]
MPKQYTELGKARVIQYSDGTSKVQMTEELADDLPMYVTFLAMNVEVLAHKLNITSDEILAIIKQNIEVEPMEFS